jgi:hypothetical protein
MATSVPTRVRNGKTEYYWAPGNGIGGNWFPFPPGQSANPVSVNATVPHSRNQIPSKQVPDMPEGGKSILGGIVNTVFGEDGFGTDDLLKLLGIAGTAAGAYTTAKGAQQAGQDSAQSRQLVQTAITRALARATEADQERAKGAPLRDEFRAAAMNFGDPTNPFRHPSSTAGAPSPAPNTPGVPATPPPGMSTNPDIGALSPDKLASLEQIRGLLGFGLPAGQAPTGPIMGRLLQAIKLSKANGFNGA